MNVLVAHNFYQVRGGEDQIYADVADLLESRGHRVRRFSVHNDDLAGQGKIAMAKMTVWNGAIAKQIAQIVREDAIDVVHFINTFPQISPAAYYAARKAGAAIVQEVQNFRLFCPAATFLRDGKVCEDCLGKLVPLPAVKHACYRDSRAGSAVVAGMLATHRALGTYRRAVDRYIAATEFSRQKFIQGGLEAHKIAVKPNFVSPDPGPGTGGDFALFVGRLSKEKGIDVMLRAWEMNPGAKLKIIGDGPLADLVRDAAARHPQIEWLGRQAPEATQQLMGEAGVLVFPSIWYEGLPKTIIESFARGTPIVSSKIGSMIELIADGVSGVHFPPGDAAALAEAVRVTMADREKLALLRIGARASFLAQFTADENARQLLAIYADALAARHGGPLAAPAAAA